MGQTSPQIPPEFENLSQEERISYVQNLWDYIAHAAEDLPVPDEHKRILDERLDEMEKNPDAGLPWEQVRKDLLAKLRKT